MEKKIYDFYFLVNKYQRNKEFINDYHEFEAIIDNICQRCKSEVIDDYCSECEELGRLYNSDKLYRLVDNKPSIPYIDKLKELKLTDLQREASDFIIDNIKNKKNSLIWAVCGAGKTEITFEAIEYCLKNNKSVCFCIPRIDILNEIKSRLELYFPNTAISVISGKEKQKENTQIFVMTTNQLLRCKGVFDFVIVDEVDAFPFSHHPKFLTAVFDSLTSDGVFCCLTSTPSEEIKNLKLETFIIYKRWHNYPLPVPNLIPIIFNSNLYYRLILSIHLYTQQRPILIFICNKDYCERAKDKLTPIFKNKRIECVHSQSENRFEIIKDFSHDKIDVLITTPILERGVTFKDVDVIVLDSDNELYNEASLVQIAGRSRRHPDFQGGNVYFYYKEYTNIIKDSKKQIKMMNNKAKDTLIKNKLNL